MKLDELLSVVTETAKENKISQPFMVGGVPRDRILGMRGEKSAIRDIDITTGDDSALKLAELLGRKLENSSFRSYDDGHASVDFRGLHMDFSSHFVYPNIDEILSKMNIDGADSMKKELYSRDFTMNTLLESLDFTAIYDITGEAIGDIQAKLIRCPIDPEITIGSDPRRILRAIKFAIKFGFKLDDKLKQAMRHNRKKIQELPTKFAQDKMNEIVMLDADEGIEMLLEYKLLPLVPLTKTISDILIQKRQLIKVI